MRCVGCSRDSELDSTFCRFCGAPFGSTASRRLTRLPGAGQIAGVCAGLAVYFKIDVTVVRLLWVVLSIVPGDAAAFTTSSLNWSSSGQSIANGGVVKLAGDREIKVFCGDQTGSTHVIIDITGYYV